MNQRQINDLRITRRLLLVAAAAAALTVAVPHYAQAARLTPPDVPFKLRVPEGNRLFLLGSAIGTQNYVCLPTATGGFAWSLFTPEATLFNDDHRQLITHFFSPNPDRDDFGAIRATWQDSRDTSAVWAKVAPDGMSTDSNFVEDGAIPWLLLERVGKQFGPDGDDTLAVTTFVQRVHTHGGNADATQCLQTTDAGKRAFVPYTADYYFYTKQ